MMKCLLLFVLSCFLLSDVEAWWRPPSHYPTYPSTCCPKTSISRPVLLPFPDATPHAGPTTTDEPAAPPDGPRRLGWRGWRGPEHHSTSAHEPGPQWRGREHVALAAREPGWRARRGPEHVALAADEPGGWCQWWTQQPRPLYDDEPKKYGRPHDGLLLVKSTSTKRWKHWNLRTSCRCSRCPRRLSPRCHRQSVNTDAGLCDVN